MIGMSIYRVLLIVSLYGFAQPASAQEEPPATPDDEALRLLKENDTNEDGKLSQADTLNAFFVRSFASLDEDSDGSLDLEEIKRSGIRPFSGKFFLERYDVDRNGEVSQAERRGPLVRSFDNLDVDQSGSLTEKEMDALRGLMILRGRPSGAGANMSGGANQIGGQQNDPNFQPSVKSPRFTDDNGPRIAIDQGHRNFHTKDGRFLPFAKVLEADGCMVVAHLGVFTEQSLQQVDILVIANALPITASRTEIESAFTQEEIELLKTWVQNGGSMMLLADHRPYGEAAQQLGAAFGVEMSGGFVLDNVEDRGRIVFSRENRLLARHAIVDASEEITSITSFTGQALRLPEHFAPLMSFGEGTVRYPDRQSGSAGRNSIDVSDWHQGAVAEIGQGRVAIFGEAGMFSAQIAGRGMTMGMNAPGAEQNQQFLLNVIRWLADRL